MNNDRQNLLIHLARGPVEATDIYHVIGRGNVYTVRTETGGIEERLVPNYVNDLNAMAQAEKTLPIEKMEQYFQWLLRVCNPAFCAGPAQRAEAFLRTINKWEEGT